MAALAFVDSHVHFYDLQLPDVHYAGMQPGVSHPVFGSVAPIQAQRYRADDYIAETRFANVVKSIHVNVAVRTADPVEETKWLQAFADRLGHPHGIVAEVNLLRPDAAAVIERHLEYANLRGVRDLGVETDGYLREPAWQKRFALLGRYGLVACVDATFEDFDTVRALAERSPGLTISLDHCGFPRARTPEYFHRWREALVDLAGAPNVVAKISGLGMGDTRWTVDSIRPWVLSCIEAFGTDRSFFGTNWPIDRLFSSYPDVVNAYAGIIADFTPLEQEAMFGGNAERIFRV